jgi:putative ABC transport system substrate-binding protein
MSDKRRVHYRLRAAPLLLAVFLTLPLFTCKRNPRVYRVGVLCTLDYFLDTMEGFRERMTELGYQEGKNIVYDLRRSQTDSAVAHRILEEFVAEKVDLIFTFATDGAVAAKAITRGTKIPVLFANSNIEGEDLVDSVKAPGGNITGVRYPGPDLTLKRFDIMRELAPEATRMWLPYRRGRAVVVSQLEALRPVAEAAGIMLIESPADDVEEVQQMLDEWERSERILFDAILMIAEPLTVTPDAFAAIARFAVAHKLPFGGAMMSAFGYTSLFGVSTNNKAVGRQAAPLAVKILEGTPAGTIPVVSAENYIEISVEACKEVGVKVPHGLLKMADRVRR